MCSISIYTNFSHVHMNLQCMYRLKFSNVYILSIIWKYIYTRIYICCTEILKRILNSCIDLEKKKIRKLLLKWKETECFLLNAYGD